MELKLISNDQRSSMVSEHLDFHPFYNVSLRCSFHRVVQPPSVLWFALRYLYSIHTLLESGSDAASRSRGYICYIIHDLVPGNVWKQAGWLPWSGFWGQPVSHHVPFLGVGHYCILLPHLPTPAATPLILCHSVLAAMKKYFTPCHVADIVLQFIIIRVGRVNCPRGNPSSVRGSSLSSLSSRRSGMISPTLSIQ